jgi:hypothetical protein
MNAPILMLSYEAPPRLSAESILAAKALKALSDLSPSGPVIDLVCASPGGEVPDDAALETLLPGTLRVHRLPPAPPGPKTLRARLMGGKDGWRRAAAAKGAALFPAAHKKPAVLYSRSHPPASHLAALDLATGPFKGVPWVAHFSDPWSQHSYYKNRVVKAALSRYERRVMAVASILVFVSEALRDLMLAGQPEELKAKALVIPHLFDSSLYQQAARPEWLKKEINGPKIMAHVGDLYGPRSPAPLFAALVSMPQPAQLSVCLVGRLEEKFAEAAARAGSAALLRCQPSVPYLQSLAIMDAADVLLAIEAPGKDSVFFPSKLVDYLGARKPIWAITPAGSFTSRLLESWGQPWCDTGDSAGIAAILSRLAGGELWPPPPAEVLNTYAAPTVARQLASALNCK